MTGVYGGPSLRVGDVSAHAELLRGSVDPGAGAGTPAPLASFYFRLDTGDVYRKSGVADTAWTVLGLSTDVFPSKIQWPAFFATGAGGTKNYGDQVGGAVYMCRLQRALTAESVVVYYRTTTAYVPGAAPNYAEIAIATGTPGASPSLTAVQYVDASASGATGFAGATGIKQTTITNVTIAKGEDIWLIWSWRIGAAGTGAVFRALSVADDLNTGVYATRAAYQPSANIGAPQTFTAEAFNAAPLWCSMGYP